MSSSRKSEGSAEEKQVEKYIRKYARYVITLLLYEIFAWLCGWCGEGEGMYGESRKICLNIIKQSFMNVLREKGEQIYVCFCSWHLLLLLFVI